ncbi:MAG: DinB family protein, partial [Acidobacteriota bacterium]
MDRDQLLAAFAGTRDLSRRLSEPLAPEDFRVQTVPEVSPPWWNLGHTTWFFARNVLEPFGRYTEDDRRMEYCMNSYYVSLGPRLERDRRGLMTRPTTDEVLAFRRSVDERMEALLREVPDADLPRLAFLVTTGIHHEQQHQELLVTEIKHILGNNDPALREPYATVEGSGPGTGTEAPRPLRLLPVSGGLHEFGNLEGGWCFDNELAVHRAYLEDFAVGDRLVTTGEFLEFVEDGGYDEPLLWLSNGWAQAEMEDWRAPLYWERRDGTWRIWTLTGERPLDPAEPV